MMPMVNATYGTLQPADRMQRRMRSPVHPFYVKARPFALMPCMIAPVWPGETLKDLMFQARAVTDPIKNPIIGWWLEFYFFYVKLTDCQEAIRDVVPDLLLNPASTAASTIATALGGTSANVPTFYPGGAGTINWVEACRRTVVQHYFRDENDAYSDYLNSDGQPKVQLQQNDVLDSLENAAGLAAVDVNVDLNTSGSIFASEVVEAMRQYEVARLYGLTELTYEDWLKSFGVNVPSASEQKPELLRYVRDWQYPSNTIDPSNGAPRSAVSWSIRERAGKDRFFREPGFICGYVVPRPKMYRSTGVMSGSFTSVMASNKAWIPPWLVNNWRDRFVSIPDNVGPLGADADTGGYAVDIGDLARYGEHMIVRRSGDTSDYMNDASVPTSDQTNKRYPTDGNTQNLFVAASDPGREVRIDGVATLRVATHVVPTDTSPRGSARVEV